MAMETSADIGGVGGGSQWCRGVHEFHHPLAPRRKRCFEPPGVVVSMFFNGLESKVTQSRFMTLAKNHKKTHCHGVSLPTQIAYFWTHTFMSFDMFFWVASAQLIMVILNRAVISIGREVSTLRLGLFRGNLRWTVILYVTCLKLWALKCLCQQWMIFNDNNNNNTNNKNDNNNWQWQ